MMRMKMWALNCPNFIEADKTASVRHRTDIAI
jgi:hypothetical protein